MRFLITSGIDEQSADHGGAPPSDELIAAYMKFNEDMERAGVLIAAEGLLPGGLRARVGVAGGKRAVVDGPFAEAKELLGGLYLIEVASREEAIAWALRCPVGMASAEVLDIYQMTDVTALPAEVRALIARHAPTFAARFGGLAHV